MHRDPNDKEEAPMDVILFYGLGDIQLAQTPQQCQPSTIQRCTISRHLRLTFVLKSFINFVFSPIYDSFCRFVHIFMFSLFFAQ